MGHTTEVWLKAIFQTDFLTIDQLRDKQTESHRRRFMFLFLCWTQIQSNEQYVLHFVQSIRLIFASSPYFRLLVFLMLFFYFIANTYGFNLMPIGKHMHVFLVLIKISRLLLWQYRLCLPTALREPNWKLIGARLDLTQQLLRWNEIFSHCWATNFFFHKLIRINTCK